MEMEICGNLIGHSNPGRDQNPTATAAAAATHNLSNSWPNHQNINIWELNSGSRFVDLDWPICPDPTTTTRSEPIWLQQPLPHHEAVLYGGGGHFHHPDPHLMCLKLGKRHYFEDASTAANGAVATGVVGKRGKGVYGGEGGVAASVARCQVEGCHVGLGNAKEYHRRHRVCEVHSKAPKVVVLGLDQRFCQQCSRFHVVSEFDDSKRSCRRRLAGHNERRRKSSHDQSLPPRNSSQENKSISGRIAYIPSPTTGRALSLLSSKNESWATSSELSLRSSAALRELIAENRAALLARQLFLDRDWHSNHTTVPVDDFGGGGFGFHHHHHQQQEVGLYCEQQQSWERMHDENGGVHVTLDLMQAPSTAFGMLSMRGKSKEEDEECCELWNSFHDQESSHVV